jgi:DNA polymerase/3'-5' exonuclease PolX
LDERITEIYKRKALDKLPGVGKSISRVIEEFLINAKRERLEKEMNTG